LLEQLDPFAGFSQLGGLVEPRLRGGAAFDSVVTIGELEPAVQATFGDSEVLRILTQGSLAFAATAMTSRRNSSGIAFGMGNVLPP
jgi:hypothetical protein